MSKLSAITDCRVCGSDALTWAIHSKNDSGVQEGRLRSSEVQCLFVLGCDECSETLLVVNADTVAMAMNEALAQGGAQ